MISVHILFATLFLLVIILIAIWGYLVTAGLLQQKDKIMSYLLKWKYGLPAPKCPQPHFRARELRGLHNHLTSITLCTVNCCYHAILQF